ncbi:MAG TPA: HEPN domain-containing protein [Terriglobia bacterium]|nr:HEPN domain-containing protein [Terriglobia bacterium]
MVASDRARAEDVRAWLQKVEFDLKACSHALSSEDQGLWPDAVFHAQQAAEKSLKAFLAWHDKPFRKTHSIEELGHACLEIDPSLASVVDRAVPLTEYAWKFRYPGEPEMLSHEEADHAFQSACELRKAVTERIPTL